jgi:hypothetical protein
MGFGQSLHAWLWRRGTVDIASASGMEDPGSNPARANIAMLLFIIDLICLACVLKGIKIGSGPIYYKKLIN